MKTRLLKEARQLLPTWAAALLLASVPGLLFSAHTSAGEGFVPIAFAIGLVVLAVAGFGREFSQRTFALFVVQPVSRERLWWEKVSVLAAGMISVVCMFVFCWKTLPPVTVPQKFPETLFAICVALAAFGGGLFLTLLLRQILAAILLAVLLPAGLVLLVAVAAEKWLAEQPWHLREGDGFFMVILPALAMLLYGLLTFGMARILFLRAQDAQWTGGIVTLPSVPKWLPWTSTATSFRTTHPLRALCWKEIQFQQIVFLLAGLLIVLQIAAFALLRFVDKPEDSNIRMLPTLVGALWVIIPLLVGCNAVAEERKLDTLEPQLCLPVSRARQFGMKALVTLGYGLALGAILPLLVVLIAWCLGLIPGDPSATWGSEDAQNVLLACAGSMLIAVVALYASTLTRHLLQAFGATIAMIALVPFLGMLIELVPEQFLGDENRAGWILDCFPLFFVLGPFVVLIFVMAYTWSRLRWLWTGLTAALLLTLLLGKVEWYSYYASSSQQRGLWIFGFRLSESSMVVLGMVPVALLLLVLAYRNFRHMQTSGRLWLRNAGTWAACLLATAVVTALVYHRVWEIVTPFEPPAGPPRLSGQVRPAIAFTWIDSPTFVLLPDGRLCFYKGYEQLPLPITQIDTNDFNASKFTWREVKNPHAEFLGGSNWVSIAAASRELIGVKSDGSLWNAYWSEWVDRRGRVVPRRCFSIRPGDSKMRQTDMKLDRIGNDSDWTAVAGGRWHFVVLKRNGTLWGWGDNEHKQLGEGPQEITNAPVQINSDSDWTAVFASSGHTIAVKHDGSTWKWGRVTKDLRTRIVHEDGLVKLNLNVPGVRRVISTDEWDLILDTDGNLWGLGKIPPRLLGRKEPGAIYTTAQKLAGSNWTDLNRRWGECTAGLKNDGSLWSGIVDDDYHTLALPAGRLGERADWLAAAPEEWGCVVALARDGTICRFGKSRSSDLDYLLAPLRRVTWSVNIFDSAK